MMKYDEASAQRGVVLMKLGEKLLPLAYMASVA
jgi:hypothetical protein